MKKQIIQIFLLFTCALLFITRASGQNNIVAAEYFFNTDPGLGNGIPLSNITFDQNNTANLIINTAGLTPGFYFLYIRVKDNNGKWSFFQSKSFYIRTPLPPPPSRKVTNIEYFFNTDPSVGNAMQFQPIVIPTNDTTLSKVVSTSGYSFPQGFNNLYIRGKSAEGKWGLFASRPFYVKSPPKPPAARLVKGEYFFDLDPGVGNGLPFNFAKADSIDTVFNFNASSLSVGTHYLYMRVCDSTGLWSLFTSEFFRICDVTAFADFSADTVCFGGDSTTFVNLSTGGDAQTIFKWDFDGNGTFESQTTGMVGQGTPQTFKYKYNTGGVFQCKLITDNGGNCSDTAVKPVKVTIYPPPPTPSGPIGLCINSPNSTYTIASIPGAVSYIWEMFPTNAGVLTYTDTSAVIDWNNTFTGSVTLKVKANYDPCNSVQSAPFSSPLYITVSQTTVGGTVTASQTYICQGSNTGNIVLTGHLGSIQKWQKRVNGGQWTNILHYSSTYTEAPSQAGIWDYRAVIKNAACDTAYSSYTTITVNPVPNASGGITGPQYVCENQFQIPFAVDPIPGATSYTWTFPYGSTIISGQGTNSILVNVYAGASSGTITVFGSNTCGIGQPSQPFFVNVNTAPIAIANNGNDTLVYYNTAATLYGSVMTGTGTSPYTYAWTPVPLIVNPNMQVTTTNALQNSTPFTVTVTDSMGCTAQDQVNVIVYGQPLSCTATSDPSIVCQGANSQLNVIANGGSGNYTYAWTSNPPNFTSTLKNPVVTPTATTQYIVLVNDGSQTASHSVTVSISPVPAAAGAITGPTTVCRGQSAVYSVPNISGANGYVWTLPYGATIASGSNTNTIVVNFDLNALSGNIKVYGTNNCGIGAASSNYAVTVNVLPVANAGPQVNITNGQQTTLNGSASGGSGNYTFLWAPASLLNNANIQNPQTLPLSNSVTFTLTVTDNQTTCSNSSSVLVLVSGFPLTVTTSAVPATICQGESSQLNALPNGSSGGYTYAWASNPPGSLNSTLQNPSVSPTVTTEYIVTVTSGGQTATSNVIVTVSPIPGQPDTITGSAVTCKGATMVEYSVPAVPGAVTYNWTLPQGASVYSGYGTNTILVNFSPTASSGNFSVYASNFCGSSPSTPNFPVILNVLPIANAGNDVVIAPGASISLNGSGSGGSGSYSYYWTPALIVDTPYIQNPTTMALNNSTTFTLYVTDSVTGCVGSAQVQAIVVGGPLQVTATSAQTFICQGLSTQLNAMPQGGTGYYTYAWTSNPGTFTSSLKNPVVTPTVTTEYTVLVDDGNAMATHSVIVTINALPATPGTITGDAQVCRTDNGVLYSISAVQGASGYNWNLPTGATIASGANTNSILVNFSGSAMSGNITVEGTNFCGTGPVSAPFYVHIDTLPVVDAGLDDQIQQNASTQLFGMAYGGTSFTYTWSPTASLINPNVQNPTTTQLAGSVNFTLLVTDNITGCKNSDQVQVIVMGVPLGVSASATPQTICQGASSNLYALPTGGTGNYTYLWSSNPSGLNSTAQNPTVNPTVSTTYTVLINDGAQTASSAITVSVNSLPGQAGTINGPTSICKGSTGVIFSVPLIQGATSYVWSLPAGATISSGANTNTINVDFPINANTGLVTVYGVNACGNGLSSSYQLTLNPIPSTNAGADLNIQVGTSDTLHGTATGGYGTYSYTWAPAILLDSANVQNPIFTPLSNLTTFYLTVTDLTSGCKGTDDVTVYIFGGPLTVAATASSTNICQGQTSNLNALPTGGTGNYTYSWSSNPSGLNSTLPNPIVTPSVTTTYYLNVTSGSNTASTSVVVSVNPLPSTPGNITGTAVVCQGTLGVVYSVSPVNGATSYTWTLPAGANIVAGAGTNSITVSFSSIAVSGGITVKGVNLCGTGPSSPSFQLTVNPSPTVVACADQFITSGTPAFLTVTVTGGIGPFSYQWSPVMLFSSLAQAQLINPTTIPLTSSASFTVTVLDSTTGCSASDQTNVFISGGLLTLTATATPTSVCQGQSVQLNALPSGGTGSYTYQWSSIPAWFNSTLQNPTVTPSVTSQFIVSVSDGYDSTVYTLVVNVTPTPDSAGTITGTTPVCQGATSVMYSVPPIPNASSYIWSLPPGFTIVSGNGTNTIYVDISNNASSGTISVFATNSCGVGGASPYFDVLVNATPFSYTSADQMVPLDTNIQIFGHAVGGSGSYSYLWTPANLLQVNNVQDPMTVPLTQSTVYTLYVTDVVTGCTSSDQVQIIVYGGPLSVAVSSNLYSICAGQSVALSALPTGGNGFYNYSWTPVNTVNNPAIMAPVATPAITTEYTVQVTAGGLTATNSVLITVSQPPGNAGTVTGNTSVCQGETGVLFTIPPIANATSYYWTVPYGATIVSGGNTNSIMVNFSNTATSGYISVYGGNMCGYGNPTPNFWVNVNQIPVVYAGPDQQITQGNNAYLNGMVSAGSGNFSYLWTPAVHLMPDNDTVLDPITMPLNNSQIFTLYVTDNVTGCTNSDYMKVIICGGPLSVDALVNNNIICEGQNVLLDALPSGGNCVSGSYTWSSHPLGFQSNLISPVDAPSVTTTYIVQYNDNSNIVTDSVIVTVNPLVGPAGPIQGPVSLCQNSGTVTYSIPPVYGATSYVWTFPQGTVFTSNPDSNVVEVIYTDTALSGFVNVYGTSLCGFGLPATPLQVTVKPLPGPAAQITGPYFMSKNNTAQFSVPPIPGTTSYYWIVPYGAVIISGQGTNSITVEFTDDSKSGFIFVFGVNSCGSGDESSAHLLTIITSLSELYNVDLKLYPNPSNGKFVLEVYSDELPQYELKILNLFGSVLYSGNINENISNLDFSHFANGMYYIMLTNDKMKIIERFVIVK